MLKEFGQLKTNAERVAFVDKLPCVHETLAIESEFSGKSHGTTFSIYVFCFYEFFIKQHVQLMENVTMMLQHAMVSNVLCRCVKYTSHPR